MIKKILVSMLIGIALGAVISELSYVVLRMTTRAPRDVILTIPAGTATAVARGEQPPSIPQDMIFVVGDTLVVINEDNVDHKLGQLWIPANSSARLALNEKENMAFECTFQPGNYFGLDVREPLTLATRIYGMSYAGVPLGIMIALYSFVIPEKKKVHASA
jgi:hypothetical protein